MEQRAFGLWRQGASGLGLHGVGQPGYLHAGLRNEHLIEPPAVVTVAGPEELRALGAQVQAALGEGVVRLGAAFGDKATVVALCSPAAIKAGFQAGRIVSELSARLGGKGGGKPDFAMGGGREVARLAEVLQG